MLAEAERIWPAPRMPPAELSIRLKTSPLLRRLVPDRLAVGRAERKGEAAWREGGRARDRALEAMAAVVCGTPREPELADVARRHVIENHAWDALFWQRWGPPRTEPQARVLLHELAASPRGSILSACHVGPYFRSGRVLVHLGIKTYAVSGEWFFDQPSSDYWGRRLARWWQAVGNIRLVRSKGSYEVLRALLQRGECVLVYFDMPGRRETRFLGKTAALADGTARLARETGAPILPMRARRDGHEVWLDLGTPIEPSEFRDADQLQRELARRHEEWILEHPAAMAAPSEFGWEDGATPQGWSGPRSQHATTTSPAR
jgi:lauroyl/myristoyl acyltransferase